MTLEARELELKGVFEIITTRFQDERGFFSETYAQDAFSAAGLPVTFVQDNHSYSRERGVLRGLHYQLPPAAQDKLVRVLRGAVYDVAVDIRRTSPTFGKWLALELSAKAWNQIFIPQGFAHGFVTLEDHTEVAYKTSAPYSPRHDRAIRFDDRDLSVSWPFPLETVKLSGKDHAAPTLASADVFD